MAKATLDPKNPPRFTAEERARLDAMSEEEIERIAASDPDAEPPSAEMLEAAGIARRVRRTRERLQLSQAAFAETFRIPLGTLRDWEEGKQRLDAPARAYLTVIEQDPDAVRRALEAAA